MSTQLWLQEARNVLAEPGFGLHFDAGAEQAAQVAALLASGRLALDPATTIYEPVGGHFMGRPDETLRGMAPDQWEVTGCAWTEVQSGLTPAGMPVTFVAVEGGDWSLATKQAAAAGRAHVLCLLTYDTRADLDGHGTGSPLTLDFGGVWRLTLHAGGEAVLSQQLPPDPLGVVAYAERTRFGWMTADRFADGVGVRHWLWVYDAGNRLVIRNLSAADGNQAGTVWVDDSAPAGDAAEPHALRTGPWRLRGSGRAAVCMSPVSYLPGDSAVAWNEPVDVGIGGSTQPCRVSLYGSGASLPDVRIADEQSRVWPQGSAGAGTRRSGLTWRVGWTNTGGQTYCLAGLSVSLPALHRSDEQLGTDLLAVTDVADKQITLHREGDLTRERLSATVQSYRLDLAARCQANLAVRYMVDGVTRFRGLSSGARWSVDADTVPATGRLELEAEGLWRRFRRAVWPGGQPFDGRLLTDCLAEVLRAAGLAESDFELCAAGYRFPLREGATPGLVYRPGLPIERLLDDLRRKFYGSTLVHYFRLSDGKFQLAQVGGDTPVATFYDRSSAALAAGVPGRTIRGLQQTLDDSAMANQITVIGRRPGGRGAQPLVARAVDQDSLLNPSAFNYVGEPWPLTVADAGLQTQAAVNWVCRSLFAQHRNPLAKVQWRSIRADLVCGDVVALAGDNYGYNVRLTGLSLTQAAAGEAAAPQGLAVYQGVRL